MAMINEPARDAPVADESDVLVVGGGPAGLSAAVAAARNGASVTLVERYPYLGGLASGGMVLVLDDMHNGTEVTVQGIGIVAVLGEVFGQFLCFLLGAAEDDGEHGGVGIHESLEGQVAVARHHHGILVGDVGVGLVAPAHAHLLGFVHVIAGNAAHLMAHGGAEEPGALGPRGLLQNGGDVLLEAHVEHLVGLVQHGHAHVAEVYRTPLQQVDQAAGRGHHHIGAALDAANLVADAGTAVYGHHVDPRQVG